MTPCSHCSYIFGVLLPEGSRQALIDAPRWLFLGTLVYAPWAYGCTTIPAQEFLELLLYTASLLWFAGWLARKDRAAIHPLTVILAAPLLCQGWFMAANAHFRHDPATHTFEPAWTLLGWAPGSVDGATSTAMMLRITALVFAFFLASDMVSYPRWRERVAWTIGLTGTSIVLLGLLQKATDASMIFWQNRETTSLFFATYLYHGNAGSYINLVFPIGAGLAVLSIRDRDAHWRRAVWIATVFLFLAAAGVNVSRSGQVITSVLLVIWLFVAVRELKDQTTDWASGGVYAGVAAAALAGMIVFAGWQRPFEKWRALREQANGENARILATRAVLRMLPDSRWWGLGPGTFRLAFPHYTQSLDIAIAGTWRYAHDDYLQTVVEWGWIGALFWAALFLGGFVKCFSARGLPRPDRLLLLGAGLALGGVAVHALIDFPFQIASLQLYIATYLAMGWSSEKWRLRANGR